jgi:hypothetical protein
MWKRKDGCQGMENKKKTGKNFEEAEEEKLWEDGRYWKIVILPII